VVEEVNFVAVCNICLYTLTIQEEPLMEKYDTRHSAYLLTF